MKNNLEDRLIEIKKPRNQAVYGVRNGGYRAYVWDRGEKYFDPEHRFGVQLEFGRDGISDRGDYRSLDEAKECAKSSVQGRAFRALLRKIT
jgi:hypothetical protein